MSSAPVDPVASGDGAAAAADQAPGTDKVSFVPLEANPEVMTALLHQLGLSSKLAIHDVYSLTEPDLLAFVPRPAHALLLVFPVSAAYESHRLAEDALLPEYKGTGGDEPGGVVWFPQTIRNACGLMGLLHAVCNGPAREEIQPNSTLSSLLSAALPLPPAQRARLIETTPALATAHATAAAQGDSAAPSASEDVDLHYVCFVRGDDGTLWELDGRRKGPLNRGKLGHDEDVLSEKALVLGPRTFLQREGEDVRFSCVALAPAQT